MTTPTPPTPDNLESQLRELTTHRGESHELWQLALDQSEAYKPAPSWIGRFASFGTRNRAGLAGVACLGVIIVAALSLPSLQGNRRSASVPLAGPRGLTQGPTAWDHDGAALIRGGVVFGKRLHAEESSGGVRLHDAYEFDRQDRAPADPTSRSVIQKATIDLQTPDVRAAFAKASYLVSAAGGEFVENSSLTGDGKTAQANLTLRVRASRLSEVLTQLRELGKVESERTTGEDVTSQVVDLEARLRNEQRIEKELLELLDKRADAPLKDILELRSSLSGVRQTIEQYIAQRDRLNHLVSLASILVVIRAEPEAEKPQPAQSILSYFKHSAAESWRDGLRSAADSISWLLNTLISGLLWWLVLAAAVYAALRYRRRLASRCV